MAGDREGGELRECQLMSRKDECGGYEVRLCRGTHWHVTICGHDIIGTYQTEAEAWEAARRLHVREDLDNGPANSPEVSQNPAKYQPTPSTEGEQP